MYGSISELIGKVSDIIWPIFLPILVVASLYISYIAIFKIVPRISDGTKFNIRQIIAPVSISLGTMIGTGAIIGVLGSLSVLFNSGQRNFESIVFWAVVGALFLVPLSYAETIACKLTNETPRGYIAKRVGKKVGLTYAICFIILHVFGFGGFQFSGINTSLSIIAENFTGISLTELQIYGFITLPIILIAFLIVRSKKHDVFINAMTYMIFTAVILYVIMFVIFTTKTSAYFPTFFANMFEGVANPQNALIGIPLGLILGLQRVIQTSETGLGALGMASLDVNSGPKEAGIITLIPTIITIFIALFVTTYISSYGVDNNIIQFTINGEATSEVLRLTQYFQTAAAVTGNFGYVVMLVFTILSGITTLLGAFYYLQLLLEIQKKAAIAIYTVLIILAGTLSVIGFTFIFDLINILLFVVIALNVLGLFFYVRKPYGKMLKK